MSNIYKKAISKTKTGSAKFAYYSGIVMIITFAILSIFLVYSHFDYKESQKRLFVQRWNRIAERISLQASKAISSKGLINDDFASYLYWIPAISKDIGAIVLVDSQNNPIYLTGYGFNSDDLLKQYAEKALGGAKQIILPEESKTGHTIIAVPVIIEDSIEAALLITLNDSPEKYIAWSDYLGFILFFCLVFVLFLAILLFAFSRMKTKHEFSTKVLLVESFLATLGSEKEKLKDVIQTGLNEIITELGCKTGAVYLKDISGGIRFFGNRRIAGKKTHENYLNEFEPGDPRLQTLTRGDISIYNNETKSPVSLGAANKSDFNICVSIPLSVQSNVFGAITLTLPKRTGLSDDLLFVYQQVVNKFAHSIHSSLEFDNIVKSVDDLQFTLDIKNIMDSAKNAQTALGSVAAKIVSIPEISFCRIFILDNKNKRLSLAAETYSGEGLNLKPDLNQVYLNEMPIHKIALMSGKTQILKAGEIEKLALIKNNLYNKKMENCTIQITPLQYANVQLGCLTVGIVASDEAEDKKEFLENIAYHVSISLKNLIRYFEVTKSFENMKTTRNREVQMVKLQALGDLSDGFLNILNNVAEPLLKNMAKLRDIIDDNGKNLEIIDAINSDIDRYKYIISKFSQFSNIRSSGQLHKLELVQIAKIAEQRLKKEVSSWGIDFGRVRLVILNSGSGQIFGNEDELYRAISAIVLNAIEAMPDGGDVTIETKIEGRMAILEISDQGTGMTNDEVKHAFEPFFTTKEGFGRGLGLSLAHRIIAFHGGEIEIKSDPGRGSRFAVKIPLVDSEQTALYSKKKSTNSTPLSY